MSKGTEVWNERRPGSGVDAGRLLNVEEAMTRRCPPLDRSPELASAEFARDTNSVVVLVIVMSKYTPSLHVSIELMVHLPIDAYQEMFHLSGAD